jgi:hypothetical protein
MTAISASRSAPNRRASLCGPWPTPSSSAGTADETLALLQRTHPRPRRPVVGHHVRLAGSHRSQDCGSVSRELSLPLHPTSRNDRRTTCHSTPRAL